jgi:hypothetical protein
VEPEIEADIMMVRQLLGLDPQGREVRVVYGAVAANDKNWPCSPGRSWTS